MSKKAWIIFIVICVVVLGTLIYLSRSNSVDVSNTTQKTVQTASQQTGQIGDHIIGDKNAKVKIIEYGDFQCPGCSTVAPKLKSIADKYKDNDVAFIFRNFPLTQIHPNARAAAAAAEAAGLQDKYWQMHDLIYEKQTEWQSADASTRTDVFKNYAIGLGLDGDKFLSDVSSDAVKAKISYDVALGEKAKIKGTPAILINDKYITDVVKDGRLEPKGTPEGSDILTNQKDFENLILIPAMKEAGIKVK